MPRGDVPAPASGGWPLGAVFGVFLVLALAIYFPCLRGEFLWDDPGHVTNPELQSWSGLFRIWFEPGVTQQYYPLLHSAFWIEHQLWGDATLGYHLVNVVWHALAGCLLVAVLRRLAVPGAMLAGLLFVVHPVCVESVAWISEQKNTLSTVLYLAAALCWLRFAQPEGRGESESESGGGHGGRSSSAGSPSTRPSHFHSHPHSRAQRARRAYVVASLWFAAALLTKTVTATLPAALLVVAWWQRGALTWRGEVRPLLPWFVAGVGAGLFTAWFERTGIGAQGADFDLSLVERGLLAGRIFWFYLGKLAWPAELVFFYPRWEVDGAVAWQYLFPAAALALVGGLWWWARRGRGRGLLAAFLLYGGTLFPALGFVNVYPFVFSYVADHFQYLASLSLFALVGAGFVNVVRGGRVRLPWRGAQAFAALVLAVLATLSWRQSGHYVDSVTLYRATLAGNPDSWAAHQNLAAELTSRGAPDEALPHARRAVELRPDDALALNNLAQALTAVGRTAEALPLLERSLQLQPRHAPTENMRGIALMGIGRLDEAVASFRRAIELQPRLADAHYHLGLAEAERGNFFAAIPAFAETIRLRPDFVPAEVNWGVALALTNRLEEARTHFQRAMKLDPGSAPVRQTYGRVLLNAGDLSGAVEQLREALRLDPGLREVHGDLAAVLRRLGRLDEARYHAQEAGLGR